MRVQRSPSGETGAEDRADDLLLQLHRVDRVGGVSVEIRPVRPARYGRGKRVCTCSFSDADGSANTHPPWYPRPRASMSSPPKTTFPRALPRCSTSPRSGMAPRHAVVRFGVADDVERALPLGAEVLFGPAVVPVPVTPAFVDERTAEEDDLARVADYHRFRPRRLLRDETYAARHVAEVEPHRRGGSPHEQVVFSILVDRSPSASARLDISPVVEIDDVRPAACTDRIFRGAATAWLLPRAGGTGRHRKRVGAAGDRVNSRARRAQGNRTNGRFDETREAITPNGYAGRHLRQPERIVKRWLCRRAALHSFGGIDDRLIRI